MGERETGMGKREKERETGMGEKDRKRERTISRETAVGETHTEREREREPLRKRGMVEERKIGIERERESH